MPLLTTDNILLVAKKTQYLSVKNIEDKHFYQNQVIDKRHPFLLYMERKAIEWRNSTDPAAISLTKTGLYVYALCGAFADQSVAVVSGSPVIPGITGYFWYGSTDPYTDLNAGNDTLTYLGTFSISHDQPLTVPFPVAATNNLFNVVKYPVSESIKTVWFNTVLNSGVIPDSVYRDIITIGSYKYIISRNTMSLDATNPTTIYS